MQILCGNIVALIACIIMVMSGYLKSKQHTLLWQTIQIGLSVFSCLILGAYAGMITNAVAVPRNILAYKGKLNTSAKLTILGVLIAVVLITNEAGWLGIVPLVSAVPYTLFMDKLKAANFKWLVIVTTFPWVLYDFLNMNYVSALFDVGTVITSIIAVIRIMRNKAIE